MGKRGSAASSKALAKKSKATIALPDKALNGWACGFRNLMAYRSSDACKKAFVVMTVYDFVGGIYKSKESCFKMGRSGTQKEHCSCIGG